MHLLVIRVWANIRKVRSITKMFFFNSLKLGSYFNLKSVEIVNFEQNVK